MTDEEEFHYEHLKTILDLDEKLSNSSLYNSKASNLKDILPKYHAWILYFQVTNNTKELVNLYKRLSVINTRPLDEIIRFFLPDQKIAQDWKIPSEIIVKFSSQETISYIPGPSLKNLNSFNPNLTLEHPQINFKTSQIENLIEKDCNKDVDQNLNDHKNGKRPHSFTISQEINHLINSNGVPQKFKHPKLKIQE